MRATPACAMRWPVATEPVKLVLYRQRHRIENMFRRLKDWRRIHTRYDRSPHAFSSDIAIAATVICWI